LVFSCVLLFPFNNNNNNSNNNNNKQQTTTTTKTKRQVPPFASYWHDPGDDKREKGICERTD